jgi:CheY-like chemotaxis protein
LITLKPEPLDIRWIVADAVEQVTPQIQARHHQLTVTEFSETAIVWGDNKRLVQVLTNLLSNAAKYTPEHGHIQLKTELHNDQVMLTVEDDGIGLAPEFIPRAFDLFVQAERTSDRSSGGLGLGLALVKSLVELHGGRVSCASPGLGKGSRFAMCLPLQVGRENEVELRRSPRNQLTASKPLKIMVVDDNVDAAQTLSLMLKTVGHQVIIEYGAKSALDVARTELPDACVLDIGLPEMDGNELARRLRARPETAKILLIALTGYGQARDREEAMAAGFDHHMVKPVDMAKLTDVLATFSSI